MGGEGVHAMLHHISLYCYTLFFNLGAFFVGNVLSEHLFSVVITYPQGVSNDRGIGILE